MFVELKKRNSILYYSTLINAIGALACFVLMIFDNTQIMGINAWIKPSKFFISIAILSVTMVWILYYLEKQRAVKIYSRALFVLMIIEQICIVMQSARGERSHFNISSAFNGIIFSTMGLAIALFSFWTIYIMILALLQKNYKISPNYALGIKLGLVLFVIFINEGWVIISNFGHTVGAKDGGEGLPYINWSKQHGDLRITHFIGMHALQIVPLFAYYFSKNKMQVWLFSLMFFFFINYLFFRAYSGLPLFF